MLKSVLAEVKDEVCLVRRGEILFLVLNRENNTFNIPWMRKVISKLDDVEKQKGASVLITIGTGAKLFSTGFDLNEIRGVLDNFSDYVLSL